LEPATRELLLAQVPQTAPVVVRQPLLAVSHHHHDHHYRKSVSDLQALTIERRNVIHNPPPPQSDIEVLSIPLDGPIRRKVLGAGKVRCDGMEIEVWGLVGWARDQLGSRGCDDAGMSDASMGFEGINQPLMYVVKGMS
jgi:hypothetical protein